ncbi:MAG: DNA topoisomerase I [Coriobacteriia bacterium]|nr:DNA topoisomerase I [Coriobacteriia bacterium]
MKLVITEKNDAAQKIAKLLGKNVKADKVFTTPVYRFQVNDEDWVTIGLRGHIMEPDFTPQLQCLKTTGWRGLTEDNTKVDANVPNDLDKPPYKYRRKPYLKDGIDLKSWKMEALPYLVYGPIVKLPKEKAIIRSLKNLAKKADSVVIATDFDREGELIGSDALKCCLEANKNLDVSRARYSAFTQAEIDNAFDNLVELDTNLADAGGSRQDIDLIWGAVLTRYLTLVRFAGYGNVRSAGRVQTPTLALVVEKERERLAFKPEKYWVIEGDFRDFKATHKTAKFKDKSEADAAMKNIEGEDKAKVVSADKKTRKVNPPTPFNTTSLMAAASSEGLTPARTMRIAESLYMGGYISYPRVDNTVYPKSLDLKETIKKLDIEPEYCQKLLAKDLVPTRGKKETTDHPPIYPTGPAKDLSGADLKLYNLIARRFLATLSEPAIVQGTKITLDVNGENFVAKGDILQTPGFRAVYPYGLKKDEQLPELAAGDVIDFLGAKCDEKETEPPARYSQGRLIQQMEKHGLGTKSTRHSIIERLYNVKYIQNDPIEPSQLGIAVIDALEKYAPHITHPEMTAELEHGMDDIAEGKNTRVNVVEDSRNKLSDELNNLLPHKDDIGEALSDAVAADAYVGPCPKCGKDLQLRASAKTKSMFIGCSGWPECDVTYPLPKGKVEANKTNCEVCGMPQIKVTAFRQKPRILCINPECDTNKEADVIVGTCKNCGGKLIARKNPKTLKRFIRCENFDECGTGYPLPQYGEIEATNEECEHCGAPMVIVNTQRGPWKLCPNFSCPEKNKDDK